MRFVSPHRRVSVQIEPNLCIISYIKSSTQPSHGERGSSDFAAIAWAGKRTCCSSRSNIQLSLGPYPNIPVATKSCRNYEVNRQSENWNTLTLYYLEEEGMVFATHNGILFSELQLSVLTLYECYSL